MLLWVAWAPASAADLEPFHTQNLSPFSALLGVPRWESIAAHGEAWRLRVDMDVANHLAASSAADETVVLDGETVRTTLVVQRRIGADWVVGVSLPYVRHSGGFLDNAIESWHDTFGLPNGGRELRPQDLLQFDYSNSGVALQGLTQDQTGLGDVSLTAARILGEAGLELHARVKLPTGDAERFTGSGGTDVGLSLVQQRRRAAGGRWQGMYWGVGVTRLDNGDLTAPAPEDWQLVGLIGSAFELTRRVNLKAQLELHSAPYESAVEELGDGSVQITFGASIALADDVSLDLALSEDILVNSAPDVALHMALVWGW